LHHGNVNDRRVLPTFCTRSPREYGLKAGLRVGRRSLPFRRRLLEPINKPPDFRFPQAQLSVFHPGRPKGSFADQAAEGCDLNVKQFGGLAECEDSVSRICSIGHAAPRSRRPSRGTAAGSPSSDTIYAGRLTSESKPLAQERIEPFAQLRTIWIAAATAARAKRAGFEKETISP